MRDQPVSASSLRCEDAASAKGDDMVRPIPESPTFVTPSEQLVWELLRDCLGPHDVLLTTGKRHPIQVERTDVHDQAGYWETYWDDDVF